MADHLLIVSPIPSHPLDQGNSARIHTLGRLLQSAGFLVHLLYCPLEGLNLRQQHEMEACWDYFHTAPMRGVRRSASPSGYRLDDWYEPAVTEIAQQLHRRWHFRAVLANYVWFSAVLTAFGADVVRVLDTHDVFGGRNERFVAAGLAPQWFYTSPAEEARGLARADIVLAIQPEEQSWFQALGHQDVRMLGHLPARRHRIPRLPPDGRVTVGYLASGNPLNVTSLQRLAAALRSDAGAKARFVVAGSICDRPYADFGPFESLGRVDEVDAFYDQVDLVVNPMIPGTGLKIKSVEAVCQGIPLIATRSAMVGLPVCHPLHALDGPEAVASTLVQSRIDHALLENLAAASHDCAADYARIVAAAINEFVSSLRGTHPGAGQRSTVIENGNATTTVSLAHGRNGRSRCSA